MAQNLSPQTKPLRNPDTYAVHRRESIWQIWLPIGLTITVLIVLVALIVITGYSELAQWAATALILLIIPTMFVGLIVLVINVGGVYLFSRVYSRLSPIMFRGQMFLQQVEVTALQIAGSLVEPAIRARQLWARLSVLRGKRPTGE